MKNKKKPIWKPESEGVQTDQRNALDQMREKCPVAHSDFMGTSLFRHEDISRVLGDHETFSNAVSQHLSVPNGMDPPEHTLYRGIINKYFTPERMEAYEPVCRKTAIELISKLPFNREVELMSTLALPFAVRNQCAFLDWPANLHDHLGHWTQRNHEATFKRDRPALSEIAREFEALIDDLIESRTEAGAKFEGDITASLMHERVYGRPLSNEEIASILRNWTVGEIGTISSAVGILIHFIAHHPELQHQLRIDRSLIPEANEEILRIHGPLLANRRITKRQVEIAGQQLDAEELISFFWVSANRDPRIFEEPEKFRWGRDPRNNLLYGAGIHACPGAPLARMELRVIMEELLRQTNSINPAENKKPVNARYPASGFADLPLIIK